MNTLEAREIERVSWVGSDRPAGQLIDSQLSRNLDSIAVQVVTVRRIARAEHHAELLVPELAGAAGPRR